MVITFNPGTGFVPHANPQQAAENVEAFIRDLGVDLDDVEWQRVMDADPHDGRFAFWLSRFGSDVQVEVEMPGIPLDKVRYVNAPGQNIWDFPRLYVDGSSWVWEFAVRIARGCFDDES